MILSFSQFLIEKQNPCWTGYKQVGLKKKGGKLVPNCVKVEEHEAPDHGELRQHLKVAVTPPASSPER